MAFRKRGRPRKYDSTIPRPRSILGRLRLEVQRLAEIVEKQGRELLILRDLAHAAILHDTDGVNSRLAGAQAIMARNGLNANGETIRRKFTPDFKIEICRQFENRGKANYPQHTSHILKQFDISASLLQNWYKQYKDKGPTSFYNQRLEVQEPTVSQIKDREKTMSLRRTLGLSSPPMFAHVAPPSSLDVSPVVLPPTQGEELLQLVQARKVQDAKKNGDVIDVDLLSILQGGHLPPKAV